jgi:hypothetical protein
MPAAAPDLASTWTVTSPSASVPPVTAETLNSISAASTPMALAIAAQAASTMPSPMADSWMTPPSWPTRTVAVGDSAVPPATWMPISV